MTRELAGVNRHADTLFGPCGSRVLELSRARGAGSAPNRFTVFAVVGGAAARAAYPQRLSGGKEY